MLIRMNSPACYLGLLLVLSAPLALAGETGCSLTAQRSAAAEAARLRHQLFATKVDPLEGLFPSKRSVESFEQFKVSLLHASDETFACELAGTTPALAQRHLAQLLHANQTPQPETMSDGSDTSQIGIFAAALTVHVRQPSSFPKLRTVQISSGIPCSDDTMLVVYEQSPTGWKDVLQWRTYNLPDDNDAFGDFFLSGILPGPVPGTWRALAVHGFPNCTSRFSGFLMDVLEPVPNMTKPRVVWHGDEGYSRGDAEPRLHIVGNTFEVRLNVAALNIDDFERVGVFRYKFQDDRVARVDPIAINARETVDEWLHMRWAEARQHVPPTAASALESVHHALTQSTDDKSFLTLRHGSVRACARAKQFQVEVDGDREIFVPNVPGGRAEPLTPTYFLLLETGSGYRIFAALKNPDPACTGHDLAAGR